MSRDLESGDELLGLSQEEVLTLLGVPNYRSDDSLSYEFDIGFRFGLDAWTYLLRIEFDKNGRADNVCLHDRAWRIEAPARVRAAFLEIVSASSVQGNPRQKGLPS